MRGGFVLALQRELRGEEELLIRRGDYLIRSTGLHILMMLQNHSMVNMFLRTERGEEIKHKQDRAAMHITSATGSEGRDCIADSIALR
jgi:hypothetical protein